MTTDNPSELVPIDLRGDTHTLPTEEMLDAMRNAELGDDYYREDPTVTRLEEMAAAVMGKEAALLVISGIMGNLTAMLVHGSPGDLMYLDPTSHIYDREADGYASIAGLTAMPVQSHKGMIDPDDLATAIRAESPQDGAPCLLCLENTHNSSGGRIIPLTLHKGLCAVAHEHELAVHLDGARIFNAAVAAGVPASAYAEDVDSLSFCLSKGLCCPLGSVLVGSRDFIDRARQLRFRIGGSMRQAGIIAAAGIVALETMVDRLAEDHANARHLAEQLREIDGLEVDMETVETNMVYVDLTGPGLTTEGVRALWKEHGVQTSGHHTTRVRLMPTRHHDRETIDEAARRIKTAMRG